MRLHFTACPSWRHEGSGGSQNSGRASPLAWYLAQHTGRAQIVLVRPSGIRRVKQRSCHGRRPLLPNSCAALQLLAAAGSSCRSVAELLQLATLRLASVPAGRRRSAPRRRRATNQSARLAGRRVRPCAASFPFSGPAVRSGVAATRACCRRRAQGSGDTERAGRRCWRCCETTVSSVQAGSNAADDDVRPGASAAQSLAAVVRPG